MKEAKVKKRAMEHCAARYVLTDASKFSKSSCVKFGEFANACIITTQAPDELYSQCENVIELERGDKK